MNHCLFTIIKENLQTFANEFVQNSHEWYPAHVVNNLDALINFFASNFLEVATESEKELFMIMKEKVKFEKEFYKSYRERYPGKQLMGSEVSERLKKMLWSLTQYAKKLDCYSSATINDAELTENQGSNESINKTEIIGKISEIENKLNELKKMLV